MRTATRDREDTTAAEEVLAAEVLGPLVASGAVDAVIPIDGLVCPARTCSVSCSTTPARSELYDPALRT